MRRCIDTIIHDQAVGPVPDGTPPSTEAAPPEVPAVPPAPEPVAELDPEPVAPAIGQRTAPVDAVAATRRRPKE